MTTRIVHGDCLKVMAEMEPGSIDAVVTDPPYHLTVITKGSLFPGRRVAIKRGESRGFMGKTWDGGDIAFRPETWKLVFNLLKPGGHMLVFSSTRTYHRMACAVEDAGFEIRDQIMWLYGSGFPKNLDVSKAIDRAAGVEREVVGEKQAGMGSGKTFGMLQSEGLNSDRALNPGIVDITAPATDAAREWDGWGTALKPSFEPLILAQKPLEPRQNIAIIGSTLMKLWSRLWLMLPANVAEQYSTLSPSACGVDVSAFAQWTADDASSTRDALCAQMDTSQFVSALISSLNTVSSWNATLAANWTRENTSITETETRPITDSKTLKSCLLAITPENIIQAHSQGHWLSADASSATRYFSAAVSRLSAILELTAAEIALSADATYCPDEAGKIVPASSPIVLARKPLDGTVAENVQEHGTGAINVGKCKVGAEVLPEQRSGKARVTTFGSEGMITPRRVGRWPANVIHDGSPEVMAAFAMGAARETSRGAGANPRFFYCAKASKEDRAWSRHPTVKPVKLIAYLCRLITPPGGTVLDPFAGSGPVITACEEEGFNCVVIEREEEYMQDLKARCSDYRMERRVES